MSDPTPPPMPGWVKVFIVIAIALFVGVVLLHLAGRGLHGH
jgi:hypothetical protein